MFWFHIKESDVVDLATGIVNPFMRAQFLFALDTEGTLRRNAEKPRRKHRRKLLEHLG